MRLLLDACVPQELAFEVPGPDRLADLRPLVPSHLAILNRLAPGQAVEVRAGME